MKIILSKQCESLTGMLNSSLGYHIEHRKNAQNKLHIADIRVSREELKQAMYEARIFIAMQHLRKDLYDARDILNLKITFSL